MKHILLISLFLLLNMLAFAQALLVRNSPNPKGKSLAASTQVIDITQISYIQAMVRRSDPSHTFISRGREKIIVEEQVLFTRPDVVTSTVGIAVMRFPEISQGLDVILDTQLNSSTTVTTDKQAQTPTTAQSNESNSTVEILDKNNTKKQSAAQNQDTDSYIHISPNPINDAAVVEIENVIHGTFQVFDITGRLLSRGQFEGNQFILERKNLNKGVYILRVLDEKSVIATKKIVVN
jgi:Secretion system C-terminal sorting domain